jgi:hypothetical protein
MINHFKSHKPIKLKKMKIYFSRIIEDHWVAKNNLEKVAHKLAKEMDRRILCEREIPAFKKEFQEKICALDKEYKRCKPLKFSIESYDFHEGDICFFCDGVFYMDLFLAKNDADSLNLTLNRELSEQDKMRAAVDALKLSF